MKRPWCWERLRAGGEGDDRGWDGWMASPSQWTWVWVNSGSWWWTGRLGMLRFMGLQRVRHDWATELNWTELNYEEAFKSIAFCFPVVQSVKNPPAMWEDLGLIPGCEDPLEKGTAIHSSILAWKIPRTEELGGLQSMGL